jgi:hypothetical protein
MPRGLCRTLTLVCNGTYDAQTFGGTAVTGSIDTSLRLSVDFDSRTPASDGEETNYHSKPATRMF